MNQTRGEVLATEMEKWRACDIVCYCWPVSQRHKRDSRIFFCTDYGGEGSEEEEVCVVPSHTEASSELTLSDSMYSKCEVFEQGGSWQKRSGWRTRDPVTPREVRVSGTRIGT